MNFHLNQHMLSKQIVEFVSEDWKTHDKTDLLSFFYHLVNKEHVKFFSFSRNINGIVRTTIILINKIIAALKMCKYLDEQLFLWPN
jgi:hypothetical protein